jgi:hypothetical protein
LLKIGGGTNFSCDGLNFQTNIPYDPTVQSRLFLKITPLIFLECPINT